MEILKDAKDYSEHAKRSVLDSTDNLPNNSTLFVTFQCATMYVYVPYRKYTQKILN